MDTFTEYAEDEGQLPEWLRPAAIQPTNVSPLAAQMIVRYRLYLTCAEAEEPEKSELTLSEAHGFLEGIYGSHVIDLDTFAQLEREARGVRGRLRRE